MRQAPRLGLAGDTGLVRLGALSDYLATRLAQSPISYKVSRRVSRNQGGGVAVAAVHSCMTDLPHKWGRRRRTRT